MTKTTQYKNTPIGPIPTEWEVKRLREAGKVYTGSTPPTNNLKNYGEEYLFVSPADLGTNKYITNTNKKLSSIGFAISRKFPAKSVLFTCIGSTIGKIGIATKELTSNQQINAIVPTNENDNEYIYYQLEINAPKIKLLAGEQAVPLINKSEFESIQIPLPPLPEQQKIAEVLSTWDKAIQVTDAIIKKLQDRNKALAFSLLTGKKRVKGFENEWRNTNFGEITKKISRRNKDLINAEVYSVTNSKGFVLQSDHFEGKVAGEDLSNYKVIKKNEFAYNPARINVGSLAYFEDEIGVISSLYVCFKTTEDVLDFYLLQYLQTEYVNSRINALGEGGVRIYLWYELFSKIKISLPSIEEQNAIAEILNTANQEVKQYQQKLEALKLQKKGLMQQLLTGKVRTV
ncbi:MULTISPECIES: restriction endonuclease subunit S [unclassified Empedobacter]|uniref:restriction endonuclease subunit S n=1 Tax=unclassified Empedobacter TaxID=2643773 RepID=UPI0025BE883E|nr:MULTISPECIES: restriction endonuclease subunit S [unclassified Empedobacter]